MSENSRQYIKALYTLQAVATRVPGDAWDNPSCCSDWAAREVAGHAAWVTRNVAATTGNAEAPEPTPEAEAAGDDPAVTIAALEPIADLLRGPGRFDDAVEAADRDAVAQFLAFTGRTKVSA